MSQNKPVTRDELHMATMDRIYATQPKLSRFPLRDSLVAAADSAPSHKLAYKIHGAARRVKG